MAGAGWATEEHRSRPVFGASLYRKRVLLCLSQWHLDVDMGAHRLFPLKEDQTSSAALDC